MSTYPLHEICTDYDDLTADELVKLRDSLRAHGLIVPIVIWREQIVDGRHRARLCEEIGIKPKYDDITKVCPTPAQMEARVKALNQHRRSNIRPLTNIEKRARVRAAITANPGKSDRQIAEKTGFSQPFVGVVRSEMEKAGDVKTLSRRTDSLGREQHAHKPAKPATPPKPTPPPPSPPASRTATPSTSKPRPSSLNHVPVLNSLSWSDASPDVRRKFVDTVGLKHLWDSASQDQRESLRKHIGGSHGTAN
jgi:hypothetical protein